MSDMYQLTSRRHKIIDEIDEIKSMRIGTLNERFTKAKNKKGEEVINGPYHVLTKKGLNNKTVSECISEKDVPRIREEVDNYKRFKKLTEEYASVCEKLSQLASSEDEGKKN